MFLLQYPNLKWWRFQDILFIYFWQSHLASTQGDFTPKSPQVDARQHTPNVTLHAPCLDLRWLLWNEMLLQQCPNLKWWRFLEILLVAHKRCLIDRIGAAAWLFWEIFHTRWKILFSCGRTKQGGLEMRMAMWGENAHVRWLLHGGGDNTQWEVGVRWEWPCEVRMVMWGEIYKVTSWPCETTLPPRVGFTHEWSWDVRATLWNSSLYDIFYWHSLPDTRGLTIFSCAGMVFFAQYHIERYMCTWKWF